MQEDCTDDEICHTALVELSEDGVEYWKANSMGKPILLS